MDQPEIRHVFPRIWHYCIEPVDCGIGTELPDQEEIQLNLFQVVVKIVPTVELGVGFWVVEPVLPYPRILLQLR